ncbi:MAG: LysR family transcriptional regulator [Deltaproteobacteria bacterium]|nr:LysR family transcriptional regulator [Deltaproteobacteria bacterium]
MRKTRSILKTQRYFQEIAHTGNLSRASERLGVGQPGLSLAVKRLEDGLEVKLFLRRNLGLTLTSAGQRLLRESNRPLAAWESVVSETKKSETEMIGRFTLGCHTSVAIYALKNVMRDLYSSFEIKRQVLGQFRSFTDSPNFLIEKEVMPHNAKIKSICQLAPCPITNPRTKERNFRS